MTTKNQTDGLSTWLRVGPVPSAERREVIASVGDTITAEEAASLLGSTVAEVRAEVAALHREGK